MKWGGRRRARYVTPDLSYYWEEAREWCGNDKWDEKTNFEKKGIPGMIISTSK